MLIYRKDNSSFSCGARYVVSLLVCFGIFLCVFRNLKKKRKKKTIRRNERQKNETEEGILLPLKVATIIFCIDFCFSINNSMNNFPEMSGVATFTLRHSLNIRIGVSMRKYNCNKRPTIRSRYIEINLNENCKHGG